MIFAIVEGTEKFYAREFVDLESMDFLDFCEAYLANDEAVIIVTEDKLQEMLEDDSNKLEVVE